MANISIINEWRYEAGLSKSIGYDSTHSYFNGAGYNGNYHVAVYKCYTDKTIISPKIKLRGITDVTNASKYLGAYFVSCSSEDNPSSSLIANSNALSGKYQTRIRFGYDFTGSFSNGSWGSYNNTVHGSGTCQSSIVIPAGYFFVYIGTGTGSSYTNWSTFGASTNTKSGYAPVISATDAPTYTISYDKNGGKGTTASQIVVQGDTTWLAENNFTAPADRLYSVTLKGNGGNDGTPTYSSPPNKFYRWRENSTSGDPYNAGVEYKPSANTTFYAQWYTPTKMGTTTRDPGETDGYEVTFNPNGGECSTSSLIAQDTVNYDFDGWNSKEDGTGTKYNSTSTYKITSTRTLYAQWLSSPQIGTGTISLPSATNSSSSTMTITLDYQGATGGNSNSTTTYKKTITKSFKGWGTSSTSTSGSTGTYKPQKTETLYAVWGSASVTYGTATLPTPTKIGYTFAGWATSASATSGSFDSLKPSSDITKLYAIWEPDGNVRIYIDNTYKMALAYIYAPDNASDTKPWKLTLVYLKKPTSTSDTKPWKLIAG